MEGFEKGLDDTQGLNVSFSNFSVLINTEYILYLLGNDKREKDWGNRA
jgi:hypothetical protein